MTSASLRKSWFTRCLTPFRQTGTIRNRPVTGFRPRLETLDDRLAPAVTINSTVTLDESPGLQTGGSATATEDNNDNDVALSDMQSQAAAFYNRLFDLKPPDGQGLGLSTVFPTSTGVGKSADTYITVDPGAGTVTNLSFTKIDGTALPVYGSGLPGVPAGPAAGPGSDPLSAVDGGAISFFSDASLGSRMVLGVDGQNQIVLAMFMQPTNATLTAARVWTVQFEPLSNPDATNFDDPVTAAGLGVTDNISTEFDFDTLPSGQNLFGMIGTPSAGLIVFGKTTVINADGTYTNASNTINTSQGGGGTTIGVNNQMFDPNEGAYFTFVKQPNPEYLSLALDANEADDADNMLYGDTLMVSSGFLNVVQTQGSGAKTLKLSAWNMAGTPQGRDLLTAARSAVNITEVSVNGVVVFTGSAASVNVNVAAGDVVSWKTDGLHDQVLVEGVAGKWDIGGFGTTEGTTSTKPLTGVRFEDDGPAIDASGAQDPGITVDESDLTTDATGDFDPSFSSAFGTDIGGSASVSYALSIGAGSTGLVDTGTGQAVVLSVVGGVVEGRTATSNDLVFTVSVDSTTGIVTLDQKRAMVHPDATDHDDSITFLAADLIKLTATVTDADGDNQSKTLDIAQSFNFKDDGPSITASAAGAPTLTVDETALATNATGAFAAQFTPVFGADGPGATPRTYALSTPGGASGLIDTATGEAVILSLVGGVVQGRTQTTDLLVFTVSVDGSGNVTLDQIRAVVHPNTASHDESVSLSAANLVVLTGTAIDGDGDSASAPLSIGQLLVFKDDGPAIGPIANSVVDFAAGSSVTKTLNGGVGADPNAAPYTIDSFTPTLTVNGVLLTGVLSPDKTVVTYFADTSGDGTFGNTGDTAYYRLTLNQSGAGTYTFEVLVDPPPALLEFNFNALPSGQNLFGTVGDASNAIVVIGRDVVLNPDGTFTNASNTINTSQGGGPTTIGVDNQMFDPGDGAYFTYVKSPDTRYLAGAPGGLDQGEADDADNILYSGGTLAATSASTTISQTQGNALASMKITAYDIADAPQGQAFAGALGSGMPVTITAVKVNGVAVTFTVSGNGVIVTGLKAGDTVEWTTSAPHDQVLIEGVAGKFDIGGFAITQAQPTPDQVLNFVAKATDGDGDTATASFKIGIDGTGIYDDGQVTDVVVPPAPAQSMGLAADWGGSGDDGAVILHGPGIMGDWGTDLDSDGLDPIEV